MRAEGPLSQEVREHVSPSAAAGISVTPAAVQKLVQPSDGNTHAGELGVTHRAVERFFTHGEGFHRQPHEQWPKDGAPGAKDAESAEQ